LLKSYPEGYQYKKNNLYYDAKVSPTLHLKAFYNIACYCEKNDIKIFQCFPLRTTIIPQNVQLDTCILMET
ncbi:hypothetical protein BGW37DRAFT_418875, partial [Umbelopsis sp. PMI_123]